MSGLLPRSERRGQPALLIAIAAFVLAAPTYVLLSVGYRALFALEAWALGAPYSAEELEFLLPSKVLDAVYWTYLITGIPAFASCVAVGWRVWTRGTVSYLFAAIMAGTTMAVFMVVVAFILRHEKIRLVSTSTLITGLAGAILVSVVVSVIVKAALHWMGPLKTTSKQVIDQK